MDFLLRFRSDTTGVDELKADVKGLSNVIDDVSGRPIDIDVNDQAIAQARDRIRELQREIADAKTLDINADVNQAAKQILRLRSDIRALTDRKEKVEIDVDVDSRRSRSSLREGLSGFKDEARQSGRESAASFSGGFSDVGDFVQEVAANAFGGFGPVGAAAGLAAAAGIGILMAEVNETNERIQNVKQSLIDLGNSVDTTPLDRYNEALKTLGTNDDLAQLRTSVEQAGVSWNDYIDAVVNGGAKVDEIKGKLRDLGGSAGGLAGIWDDNVQGAQSAYTALDNYRTGADAAIGTLDAQKAATEGLVTAQDAVAASTKAVADALGSFVDPAQVYRDTLSTLETAEQDRATATANATKDSKDSWEDYVNKVDVSVDQYLDALAKQVSAQEDWASNMAALARRGVEQGVLDQLARMGPEGAPLVAKLTSASDAELSRMNSLFARKGATNMDNYTAAVQAGTGAAAAAGGAVAGATRERMEIRMTSRGPILVPVSATVNAGSLSAARDRIANALAGINVTAQVSAVFGWRPVP